MIIFSAWAGGTAFSGYCIQQVLYSAGNRRPYEKKEDDVIV